VSAPGQRSACYFARFAVTVRGALARSEEPAYIA